MGRLDSLVTSVRLISHSSLQLMYKYILYFYSQFDCHMSNMILLV